MQRLIDRSSTTDLTDEIGQRTDKNWSRIWRDFQITVMFLAISGGIGIAILFGQRTGDIFVAILSALACLASGGIIGFLFGIPRVVQKDDTRVAVEATAKTGSSSSDSLIDPTQSTQPTYRMQVNTNLEQISDWLTKIIVGIGLIELRRLPSAMDSLSRFIASGMGAQPQSQVFAGALIIYFAVLGFLGGYLITRIYLAGAFYRADWGAQNTVAVQAKAVRLRVSKEVKQIFSQDPDAAKSVTEGQIQAAERVERLTAQADLSLVRKQMQELAREYEQIRASMPSSDLRTRRMEIVATKMRTLALACAPLLQEFISSKSAGERLSAVMVLQMTPDQNYLQWLAERLDVEKPFIGYHAAVALLSAARVLEQSHRPSILSAIRDAKIYLGSELMGTDRWNTLESAERELNQKPSTDGEVAPLLTAG